MAQYYQQFTEWLESVLSQQNRLTDALEKVEKMTNVKRVYIAQGALAFFALYMIIGHFAALVCNAVGFVYPAYASILALESSNKDDDTKWLTYWVVFAFFSVIEFFSDFIFSWFPFYWLAKVIFLVWCFIPIANNGSVVIYNRFIRPVFLKNQGKIDSAVSRAAGIASEVLESAASKVSSKSE